MAARNATKVGVVKAWLRRFAARMPVTQTVDEIEDAITISQRSFTQMSADMFTDESLEAMIAHFRSFPPLGELKDRLRTWHAEQRPADEDRSGCAL
jgi:hypothetical protein